MPLGADAPWSVTASSLVDGLAPRGRCGRSRRDPWPRADQQYLATSVRATPLLGVHQPTAQTPGVESTVTPLKTLSLPLALGLGTTDQPWPSKCSTKVRKVECRIMLPTAQTSLEEVAATADRTF